MFSIFTLDSLPNLSLGTAALIIFGVCVAYMLIRGLAQTFVNVACLCLSAWLAFRVWQFSPSLSLDWLGKNSEALTLGLPIAVFILSFLLLRWLIRFLFAPTIWSSEDVPERRGSHLVLRVIFTILPALALFLIGATIIHHAGSLAELKNFGQATKDSKNPPSLVQRLSNSLSAAIPQNLMTWLDPLTSEPRLQLAKLITANADKSLPPVINPKTGKPYPRAIVVDDPELLDLARTGSFSKLLRHPLLTEALKDPKIQKELLLSR